MSAAQLFQVLSLFGLFTSVVGFATKTTRDDVIYLWRRPGQQARSLFLFGPRRHRGSD